MSAPARRRAAHGLGFLALLGSVVAEFQFSSRIDLQLALNARDELQAEMNALSALRMRALHAEAVAQDAKHAAWVL